MQPFLTKTLLSMLAGSFHLACKVTLTSRREAILPSPLYILPNTTQRYYFVISLNAPRALFCAEFKSCGRDFRSPRIRDAEGRRPLRTRNGEDLQGSTLRKFKVSHLFPLPQLYIFTLLPSKKALTSPVRSVIIKPKNKLPQTGGVRAMTTDVIYLGD